ncbi:MAG: IPT/TIG domain-containing protein, partial [bacterium]
MKIKCTVLLKFRLWLLLSALVFCLASTGYATDYTFQWEKNPFNYLNPNTNIVAYRIYYSATVFNFNNFPGGYQYREFPDGPYDPDNLTTQQTITITPDPGGDQYFVIAAVNELGIVGAPSNIAGTHAPRLDSVSPSAGSRWGGSEITLTGGNLFYGIEVWFGDEDLFPNIDKVDPTNITYVSINEIRVILPPYTAGTFLPAQVSVIVRNFTSATDTLVDSFTYLNFGIYEVRVKNYNSKYRLPEITLSTLHLNLNDTEARFSVFGAINSQQAYTWKFYKNGGGIDTFNTTYTNSFTWNISALPVPAYYKVEVYDTSIPPTSPSYPQYSHVLNFDVHVPSAIETKWTTAEGGSLTTFNIIGGDADSYYDWTITYPGGFVDPYTGSLAAPNKSLDFTAPDLPSCFAGTYSFEVNDNFGVFSDSFDLKVPLRVEVVGGTQYIIYDTENLIFSVEGSCSGSSTATNLYEYDKNGARLYPNSSVANTGGPPPDEEFTFSPDVDFLQDVYTRLSFTAAGADTVNYNFRVIPLVAVQGRVIDGAGNGIVGATISVLAPDLPAPPLPVDVKEQWQTITDGYFPTVPTVKLPYTQETYSFLISAPDKIDKTVYSADFQLGEIE